VPRLDVCVWDVVPWRLPRRCNALVRLLLYRLICCAGRVLTSARRVPRSACASTISSIRRRMINHVTEQTAITWKARSAHHRHPPSPCIDRPPADPRRLAGMPGGRRTLNARWASESAELRLRRSRSDVRTRSSASRACWRQVSYRPLPLAASALWASIPQTPAAPRRHGSRIWSRLRYAARAPSRTARGRLHGMSSGAAWRQQVPDGIENHYGLRASGRSVPELSVEDVRSRRARAWCSERWAQVEDRAGTLLQLSRRLLQPVHRALFQWRGSTRSVIRAAGAAEPLPPRTPAAPSSDLIRRL
jgi:hypothetical protein